MKILGVLQEGGGEPPHAKLGWAIDEDFGSFEALVKKMSAEGAALQGSGWVVCTPCIALSIDVSSCSV
jgi:Fe-Mn family superoxide dismutase